MSSGVLFIAFDSVTDQGKVLKYTKLAEISKNLVKKHLGLPCAIVSDSKISGFDESIVVKRKAANKRHVLIGEKHENYEWHNNYRIYADQFSPWSRTLLLDVDYFVQTDSLTHIVESDSEFSIVKDVFDITGRDSFNRYQLMPNRTIPQLWATVMCWDTRAAPIFEYARKIEKNYEYYAKVFGFPSRQIRNDMIFSISSHMTNSNFIPSKMWMSSSDCSVVSANHKGIKFSYQKNNKLNHIRVNNDIHILSKSLAANHELLDHLEKWSLS